MPTRVSIPRRKEKQKKEKGGVSLVELIAFVAWLVFAGTAGYFIGMPIPPDCEGAAAEENVRQAALRTQMPVSKPNPTAKAEKPKCIPTVSGSSNEATQTVTMHASASTSHHHPTLAELKKEWQCARAELNESHGKIVHTEDNKLVKTKWNTIMTFSPKPFFDRYLAQYPVDTVSHQPVLVFSHKPVKDFDQLTESCKVMDIALVPDLDDVCVAVTETFHDVASYHMLHAERRESDGTFGWKPNNNPSRFVPTEAQYVAARALYGDYFKHMTYVEKEIMQMPRFRGSKTAVGVLIEDLGQAELFENSVASGKRAGISKTKFCIITTSAQVKKKFTGFGIKLIHLPKLADVGHHPDVSEQMRRNFILAWLGYACANKQLRVLWQSPGTIWLDRPDNVLQAAPEVETFWVYKGKYDEKASPFYASFDFAGIGVEDRPIHLMHEVMLHFELALAWGNFDSMASYRISENNARYGTTTYMMPPTKVLHTRLLHDDPVSVYAAVSSDEPPMVVVVDNEAESEVTKKLLVNSGLWFLSDSTGQEQIN